MEPQKTPNSQNNPEKKEWRWKHHATWLQIILRSSDNQKSIVLATKQTHKPMNKIESPEIKSHVSGQIVFDNGAKTHNGEKKAPSVNGAGKIGKPHKKEWN